MSAKRTSLIINYNPTSLDWKCWVVFILFNNVYKICQDSEPHNGMIEPLEWLLVLVRQRLETRFNFFFYPSAPFETTVFALDLASGSILSSEALSANASKHAQLSTQSRGHASLSRIWSRSHGFEKGHRFSSASTMHQTGDFKTLGGSMHCHWCRGFGHVLNNFRTDLPGCCMSL